MSAHRPSDAPPPFLVLRPEAAAGPFPADSAPSAAAPSAAPPSAAAPPAAAPGPLVLSVPHAGRFYPEAIDAARAVGWPHLFELEDRYVDRLLGPAVAAGATAIVATHARAWIDLNRDAADRDHAPSGPHGRAGLGLIPQRAGGRPLWRRPPREAEVLARVAALHLPYHGAVAAALAAARAAHGHALLIDCHSMPPIAQGAGKGAMLVIGDRHGTSAAPAITAALLAEARVSGIAALRNTPYAGAYTLERHGRPAQGVHAVQLEFDRSLYLEPGLREPAAAAAAIAGLLARLCRAALAALAPLALPDAAE